MTDLTPDELLAYLASNRFIDDLRLNLLFNEVAYDELIWILHNVAIHVKDEKRLDKKLCAYLYEVPKMIMIWKERLKLEISPKVALIDKLEDDYFEIDALIPEEILHF